MPAVLVHILPYRYNQRVYTSEVRIPILYAIYLMLIEPPHLWISQKNNKHTK